MTKQEILELLADLTGSQLVRSDKGYTLYDHPTLRNELTLVFSDWSANIVAEFFLMGYCADNPHRMGLASTLERIADRR